VAIVPNQTRAPQTTETINACWLLSNDYGPATVVSDNIESSLAFEFTERAMDPVDICERFNFDTQPRLTAQPHSNPLHARNVSQARNSPLADRGKAHVSSPLAALR
jgi:hypothetical protein